MSILREIFVKLGLDLDAQSFTKGELAAEAISKESEHQVRGGGGDGEAEVIVNCHDCDQPIRGPVEDPAFKCPKCGAVTTNPYWD